MLRADWSAPWGSHGSLSSRLDREPAQRRSPSWGHGQPGAGQLHGRSSAAPWWLRRALGNAHRIGFSPEGSQGRRPGPHLCVLLSQSQRLPDSQ